VTRARAIARLRARGLSEADAAVVVDHLLAADGMGRSGHGLARIPWLEGLLGDEIDPRGRPRRDERAEAYERWHGGGALGYLTLAAVCDALVAEPPAHARLVLAEACFPTGALGAWARRLADAGLVALVTATSPRRLPHPDGGPALTGTNPIAIAVPSSAGDPVVADVSMGAVTHGDVLTGVARPEELVPFGGPLAHKAFALAVGVELLVRALAGPEPAAVVLAARPEHDPVPAFRALAAGLRLPGDGPGTRAGRAQPDIAGSPASASASSPSS
jgi:LDH2 family malate/lactate/ureidoglycolate dehydrogenase